MEGGNEDEGIAELFERLVEVCVLPVRCAGTRRIPSVQVQPCYGGKFMYLLGNCFPVSPRQ